MDDRDRVFEEAGPDGAEAGPSEAERQRFGQPLMSDYRPVEHKARNRGALAFFMPVLVLGAAVVTGGWFLQKDATPEENVYLQARLFQEVVDFVANRFVDEVNPDALFDNAIDGIISELDDPNSSFIDSDDREDFWIRADGDYSGVGLEVVGRPEGVTVVSPIPGGPGIRAGIRAGDVIAEVDGVSVEDWTSDEVVELLRGQAGEPAEVKIRRPGIPALLPFTLVRSQIELRAVPFATMLEGDIGYVPIETVNSRAAREMISSIEALRARGMRGLILDLRGNPGGFVDQAVEITDLFLPREAEILEIRGREDGAVEHLTAPRREIYEGMPVVVLVDGQSASASEIIAGALQDHDRGIVIGEVSFGKGSVQTLFPLSGGNMLRLTTGRWFTPLGRSIQKDLEAGPVFVTGGAIALDGSFLPEFEPEERPEFTTGMGRTVFGGGGIVPDVVVKPEALTRAEEAAVRELLQTVPELSLKVFDLAVDYVQNNSGVAQPFRMPRAELDRLFRELTADGRSLSRQAFDGSERFIRYQFEREVAIQALGDEAAFLQGLQFDRVVLEALNVLREIRTTPELLDAAAERVEFNQNAPSR